jgi:hypothetical protein
MMQQPPRPLYPGNRPITARENLLRLFAGEKPSWMPVWLTDSQVMWPDLYAEHAPLEGTGYDWWGQHWTYVPGINGQMPTPGYRVLTDIAKWREQVKPPNLDGMPWDEDAKTPGEARELVRRFVDKYAPRGKIVANSIAVFDPEIQKAAFEELYYYSSEFYAKR